MHASHVIERRESERKEKNDLECILHPVASYQHLNVCNLKWTVTSTMSTHFTSFFGNHMTSTCTHTYKMRDRRPDDDCFGKTRRFACACVFVWGFFGTRKIKWTGVWLINTSGTEFRQRQRQWFAHTVSISTQNAFCLMLAKFAQRQWHHHTPR